MPPQAKKNSPEGAAAFVKHYIDVFNYASNTGDVRELLRLSSPKCEGCQSYIKLYRDTYKAGGYFKGSNWVLADIELEVDQSHTKVFARATSDAGKRRDSRNSRAVTGDAEDVELIFSVETRGTHRRVHIFERSTP